MSLLELALTYHARNMNVLPLRGKVAAIEWIPLQEKRISDAELRKSFRQRGITGIGVLLGRCSDDLIVRDFDKLDAFRSWEEEYPDVAKALPRVSTPRPGVHIYDRWPVPKTIKLGDGELRGEKGICVLPPSVVDDKAYEWINELPPGELLRWDPQEIGLAKTWGHTIQPLQAVTADESRFEGKRFEVASLDEVVRLSIPKGRCRTDDAALTFGRLLLNLESTLGNAVAEGEVLRAIGEWYRISNERGLTRQPPEYYEEKFLRARKNAKYPMGCHVLQGAFDKTPTAVPPRAAVEQKLSPKAMMLATFFREAQRVVGPDKIFFVSNYDLSSLLAPLRGTDQKTMWEMTQALVRRGFVKCVDKGKPRSKECPKGLAASFQYLHSLDE